jgi:uncharacterized membrane protein
MALGGHPLHPVIGVAPLALLCASLASDVAGLVTGDPEPIVAARWALGAGCIAGVAAAVPGVVDALAYPRSARSIPIRHGVLNTLALAAMTASWWLRKHDAASVAAFALSAAAAVLAWTGWRLGRRLTAGDVRPTASRS